MHKGRWHGEVAIRLLEIDGNNQDHLKLFKKEVMNYRQTRHENVVLFMGACMAPPHLAIITRWARTTGATTPESSSAVTRHKSGEHISPVRAAALLWHTHTHTALNGQWLSSIANSLVSYLPPRTLQSSAVGEAAFVIYTPKLWNTLLIHVSKAKSKRKLKTLIFTQTFH